MAAAPSSPSSSFTTRALQRTDWEEWKALWNGYLTHYEIVLSDEVYISSFNRMLTDNEHEFKCLVAVNNDSNHLVGLAHFQYHRTGWAIENTCYLQDLFVLPSARGHGVGRSLIEAVYQKADENGTPSVYWWTQHNNERARRLYDKVAFVTPFIEYDRSPDNFGKANPTMSTDITIRALQRTDWAEWKTRWNEYLTFYETVLSDEVSISSFNRMLTDNEHEFKCLVAVNNDSNHLVGLAHFQYHRTGWTIENTCYLQDLFVLPSARGHGVGRSLIEAVYQKANENGTPSVYWSTQQFNTTARRLYDKVADQTPFIKYKRNFNVIE